MKVQELMTRNVVTCRAGDDLNRAAHLMWEGDCGVVPVVDGEGRVIGIVTDRDACMSAYTRGARLCDIRVEDAMSKQVSFCSPDASVPTAMTMMKEARVRRMPVIDNAGKLVGLVSLNDLAREAYRQRKNLRDSALAVDVADMLAVICDPRRPVATTVKSDPKRAGQLAGAGI
jgi:CBS domain-containing protein